MTHGSKTMHDIAGSLKRFGDIQINDWDFEGLMNKDLRDIEFAKSLRRLGSIRVMEWDFKDVLPAVNKLAHQEVDIVDLVKWVADYKVMEWDFRSERSSGSARDSRKLPSPEEMQALILKLNEFLRFAVASLIDEPSHAQVKVCEIAPGTLRFRLVLLKSDVSKLIGTGGHTAAAIRNLLKSAAGKCGVSVLLQILSHEEDMVRGDDASEGD